MEPVVVLQLEHLAVLAGALQLEQAVVQVEVQLQVLPVVQVVVLPLEHLAVLVETISDRMQRHPAQQQVL